MVICPDCGKEVLKEKFCKNCGAYLENIEEPVKIDAEPAVEVPEANVEGPGEIESESAEGAEKLPVPIQENEKDDSRYCFNCGFKLTSNYHFCPNCGQDLNPYDSKPKNVAGEKSTLLAVILSVILPGLGQIYLGLDNKGAIFLIAYIVSAFLILFLISILLLFVIWIWALIDTIISINALNRGDEVIDKLF